MIASKNFLSRNGGLNKFIRLFIALLILLIYSACSDDNLISQTYDIRAAKEQWEKTNIEDYHAEVERICYCAAPFRYTISVEDGEIVQIRNSETGEAVELNEGYSTIDELFIWLQQAASHDPKKLDLEFHPELGYPTFIDYNQSDNIADEELLLRVHNFEKN